QGKPIRARPAGAVERTMKWARRRPAAASLLGAGVLAVLAAVAAAAWHINQLQAHNLALEAALDEAGRQRTRAEDRERRALRESYAGQIRMVRDLWANGKPGRMGEMLQGLRPGPDTEDLRGFEWRYLWRLAQKERYLDGHR